ncbi:phage terminase large subunit family protein [Fusobacterium nucleatum]|jgi:phage terminase large subunit (gpA)|uniref:Phage terminase GpA n=1 Tax=Fusobacterium animalis D11 TaxID=556264 RepID=D6BE05_9FUSO|nr:MULTISPECIES: terminase gpA endonuclease subunit [Fusobacterium]EFD80402.1 phage terminase GpA [Fusobacterium animalis D11]MCL4585499.1 terminase [Fusobacterium nucleatum YWH7055]
MVSSHTKRLIENIVKEVLAPAEDLTVAEWADKYRILSRESAAEAGKWDTNRTPYMKEILMCITDIETKKITMMCSAQIGKTEMLLNVLGRYMHLDPCPILFVQPTVDDAKSFSKERVEPMIRDTTILKKLISKTNKREEGTVQEKMFPGGYVRFVGANSPSGLASRPIRITLLDEIDRFPLSARKEGDPVKLAERRTNNFYDSKNIRVSTPTDDATSKIQLLYLASSQEEWCLPCPFCGEYQPLDFEQMKYLDLEEPELECKFCGHSSQEKEWKSKRQLNGKWIAKFPVEKEHRGFHLNALASPWVTWKEIVKEFLEVKDDDFQYRTFMNTVLGKTFSVNLEAAMDYEAIYETREDYGAELHDDVVILTAGVDVQDNRLEVEVVGWGYEYESYGIMYRDFPGDPGKEEVWQQLDTFLKKKFYFKNKKYLTIAATLIDSGGHHTGSVYKYVYKKEKRGIYAIKGQGAWGVNILNGFRKTTKKGAPQINLLSLGVNALKDLTYSRLSILEGAGKCHFPKASTQGYGIDYFKGLTAEVKVKKSTPRGMKIAWEILDGRRNEPLDLRNYNTAAIELIPIDLHDKKYNRKGARK